jgi:hypothetical protein
VKSFEIAWFFELSEVGRLWVYRQQKRLIWSFGTLTTNRPEKMQPPHLLRAGVSGIRARVLLLK